MPKPAKSDFSAVLTSTTEALWLSAHFANSFVWLLNLDPNRSGDLIISYYTPMFQKARENLQRVDENWSEIRDAYRIASLTPVPAHDEARVFAINVIEAVTVVITKRDLVPIEEVLTAELLADKNAYVQLFTTLLPELRETPELLAMSHESNLRIRMDTELAKAKFLLGFKPTLQAGRRKGMSAETEERYNEWKRMKVEDKLELKQIVAIYNQKNGTNYSLEAVSKGVQRATWQPQLQEK